MPDTIKVPGIGPVKKNYVYVAGAGLAAYVGYAWWTRGGGLAPAPVEEVPVDEFGDERITPTTIDTYDVAVDTRTGLIDNAEWSQFAISHLAGLGYDSTVVSTAIGRFLARKPLNKVDVDLARQAWAVAGEPPEGRPWTIIEETTPAAVAPGPITGLKIAGKGSDWIAISWDATEGAAGYEVRRDGGGVARKDASMKAHFSTKLPPATSQTFHVRAFNSANNFGPEATITGTTGGASSGGYTVHRIGRVGGTYNMRSQAQRFSPNKSPDAVESFLRRMVELNPALRGRTTIPGGFALKVPK